MNFSTLTNYKSIANFNSFLFSYFLNLFGPALSPVPRTKCFDNKALRLCRIRKKELRSEWRKFVFLGTTSCQEAQKIRRERERIVKRHNQLRKIAELKSVKKAQLAEEKRFRSDPHKFAAGVFKGKECRQKPTFSQSECQAYFESTFADSQRDHVYQPLPGSKRPVSPHLDFNTSLPTIDEYSRVAKKKRNKAAPGPNNLPYTVYKRCPAILCILYSAFKHV